MNNIWYLCAAVIRQPRAYLHIAEYSRLLKDLYSSTPYSYRPDATLSAACMLLEKTGTQRTDIVRFCTKLKNDNRQYLAEKFRLQQIRDKAWQITTDVSLDDFIGVPPAAPFADARDLRIGELTARLELATRQLAEAEKEKKELSGELSSTERDSEKESKDCPSKD